MEREDIHAILTQNNLESGKQSRKWKIKVQGEHSVPCDESVMKAKERLQKDIEDGKYCLGKPIVPKEYKKNDYKI